MRYKYESNWHTQDLFKDYYTKTEVDTLLATFIIPIQSAEPTNPLRGMMYIDSDVDTLYIYNGTAWQVLHVLSVTAPPVLESGVPMGLLLALTYEV